MPWTFVVKCFHHRLGLNGHLMPGALAEIADFFRMPHHQAGAAVVAGVVAGYRISAAHGCRNSVVIHGSAQSAVPGPAEFPIPSGRRHPDLDLDFGIRNGPDGRRNPAERRQLAECITLLSLSKRTCSDRLRHRHDRILDGEPGQAFAGRRRRGKGDGYENHRYVQAHIDSHCIPIMGVR